MESSSIAPVGRRSNEALGSCASGLLLDFLARYSEIASKCARAPRLAPGPGEVVGWGASQRLVIVWDGASGKTIRTGWRARHHIPPATGAMHALHICTHGGVIYIYTGP